MLSGDWFCTILSELIQRKLPSPGFQVEIVLVDYDGTPPSPTTPHPENVAQKPGENPGNEPSSAPEAGKDSQSHAQSEQQDKDDVFSDDESEGSGSSRGRKAQAASSVEAAKSTAPPPSETNTISNQKVDGVAREVEKVSLGKGDSTDGHSLKDYKTEGAATTLPTLNTEGVSESKAMAADASVFTFGDEDYESD